MLKYFNTILSSILYLVCSDSLSSASILVPLLLSLFLYILDYILVPLLLSLFLYIIDYILVPLLLSLFLYILDYILGPIYSR